MRPSSSHKLRSALVANAAFSSSTGAILSVVPDSVGMAIGLQAPLLLRVIGLGLLAFAGLVAFTATRARLPPASVTAVSFADLMWVLASVGLAGVSPPWLTSGSLLALAVVAAVVLALAVAQLTALRSTLVERRPGLGAYHLCLSFEVEAGAEAMWRVISDLGSIAKYAPDLVHSELIGGGDARVGCERRCRDRAGATWTEQCTAFKPKECAFTLRFVTEAPDFPFPAKTMFGGWQVQPRPRGAQVQAWWSLSPSMPAGWLALSLMSVSLERSMAQVIRRMESAALGRATPQHASVTRSAARC